MIIESHPKLKENTPNRVSRAVNVLLLVSDLKSYFTQSLDVLTGLHV